MEIRVVRMRVHEWIVLVPVAVRLARRIASRVRVMVMFVVGVKVLVLGRRMFVDVFVTLADVQPDARAHQSGRGDQARRRRLPEHDQRDQRADKRRHGKIRARPRGAEMPQCENEEHEAHPIAEEAEEQRATDARDRRESRA